MNNLSNVDHISLCVADIKQAVHWYTTSFSCKVLYQEQTEALLEFANTKLQLILPSQQPPHLGFKREDAETFGELRQQLDGSLSTFISDPTGNIVEIIKK